MHKLSNGNVPKSLQNLYQCNQNVHTHYTRQASHVHSMKGNNEFVYQTFVFQSVYLKISYYLIIFHFDMTNKTPHHYLFSSRPVCYAPPLRIVLIVYVCICFVMYVLFILNILY